MAEPIHVLLVEDSPADARLTVEALRDPGAVCQVHVVEDGVEALRFLRRYPPYTAAPRPNIILLDLNLPEIDGKEVLAEIKSDELLLEIPVVVLSGSANQNDINYAYQHHVSCYITKSSQLDEYFTALRMLKALWFHTVAFPEKAIPAPAV